MNRKISAAEVFYRAVAQRAAASAGRPSTFDRETRSVEVTAATEDPVTMWDWDYGEIPEVLLMKGAQIPAIRQIPLLDTHSRYSTSSILGSTRELATAGEELRGRAVFSNTEQGEHALTLVEEGHLTDVSIGYRINAYETVKKGEKATVAGRTWEGPIRVVTSWSPRELSVCPIGADGNAKMRAEASPQGAPGAKREAGMDRALRLLLQSAGLSRAAGEAEAWEFYLKFSLPQETRR